MAHRTLLLTIACALTLRFAVADPGYGSPERKGTGAQALLPGVRQGQATPTKTPSRLRATPKRSVACASDSIARQPNALADIDGDGRLDRVSVRREGRQLIVAQHALPDLQVVHSWVIAGDYVEVGTTRAPGSRRGQAWLLVGQAPPDVADRVTPWTFTVYRIARGVLAPELQDVASARFDLDLDGDGLPDPLVSDQRGARALLGSRWTWLPKELAPTTLRGLPIGDRQQQAVDLDGDGDRELLVLGYEQGLSIVELPSFRRVFHAPGRLSNTEIGTWAGRRAIFANLDQVIKVLGGGPSYPILAEFKDASFGRIAWELDPAGDDSTLVLQSLASSLVRRSNTAERQPLESVLQGSQLDGPARLRPVRIDDDAHPDLLGIRMVALGSPTMGGQESGRYQVTLLAPPGTGAGRVIFEKSVGGSTSAGAELLDLDGDGRYEILLQDSGGYANCDVMSGGGSSSTVRILDGSGAVLWEDETRHSEFGGGYRRDRQAQVRVVDLFGDGRTALRVRAQSQEWYVVPANAQLPNPIPECIE